MKKDTKSLGSFESLSEKDFDTLQFRIGFIQELLEETKLEPMINIEDPATENFLNPYIGKEKTDKIYNTKFVLKKKILNFKTIISSMGGRLQYIKSGSTGHAFKGYTKTDDGKIINFGVKVVAYPRRYGSINDVKRPENAELMMIKLLSYFVIKKQTPYIILPIATFNTSIETFVKLAYDNVIAEKDKDGNTELANEKFIDFVKSYEDGVYHDNVSILMSEWANRGDLLSFIKKNYRDFTLRHWKVLFFQIISVLAVIQHKYPSFRHNDLKANNILIHHVLHKTESVEHTINYFRYVVPTIGYQIKLWDFDFACIPGLVNNRKVNDTWTTELNINPVQNRYYDIHYFFNTLIRRNFFGKFMTDPCIPKEAQDFVNRIIPLKYQEGKNLTGRKGDRFALPIEYMIPEEILRTDPFFEEFRRGNVDKIKKNKNPLDIDSIFEGNTLLETKEDNVPIVSSHKVNHIKRKGSFDRTKRDYKKREPNRRYSKERSNLKNEVRNVPKVNHPDIHLEGNLSLPQEVRDREIRDREVRDREIRDREVRDREVRDREVREGRANRQSNIYPHGYGNSFRRYVDNEVNFKKDTAIRKELGKSKITYIDVDK